MAENELGSRYNWINLQRLNGADGSTMDIGEGLFENNEMLQDAYIAPASAEMSHEDLRASSIPTAQIVAIGNGWDASVVQWDSYKDDISLFKDRAQFPEDALKLAGDMAGKRAQIIRQHMEGFGQSVQNHIIYGSSAADPEKFDGLGVRYTTPDDRSSTNDPWNPASTADYGVLDAGGTGAATTSIWLIQWGAEKCSLRTPKNDPNGGIRVRDMGLHIVTAENSKSRWDYINELEWALGISIKDIRSVVRIRNISTSSTADHSNLIDLVEEAKEYFWGSETVWMYTNRKIRTFFKKLVRQQTNVLRSVENPYKIPLLMFDDTPIRRCDAITNAETAVTAA